MKCGLLTGILFLNLVGALRLTLNGRSSLRPRGNISGVGNSTLRNTANVEYVTTITLGGKNYDVLVDTGSADLWVADGGSVPSSNDIGITSTVSYAVGTASGPVKTASLGFAGYTVTNQAFMQVNPSTAQGTGVIGLGPDEGSNIYLDTNKASVGYTVLDNLFLQNSQTPNILTIILGRSDDPSEHFSGDLTVGETIPGYDDVVNQPKLSVTKVSASAGTQHFQVLLDENGIIGPDGNPIPVTSGVDTTSDNKQLTVVFDSGFTLPQVPKSVSDAIYGRFPNAEFVNVSGLGNTWILPCTTEVNISFTFAGQNYPIHPLDATLEPSALSLSNVKTSSGLDACIGMFQPLSFAGAPTYDAILGMAFLRNAYMLTNFGNFVGGGTSKVNPYIQLLSITNNTAERHSDFVTARLGGVDTTGTIHLTDAKPASQPSDSGSNSKNTIFIVAGGVVGGLVLVVIAAVVISSFRKRNRYQKLNNATYAAPPDVYMVRPTGHPVYNPELMYTNPFEHGGR